MSVLVKVLTGAAGLAAVVGVASPAAAQYYPGYGYGYNNGGGVVGAIVNSVIGGGQYGYGNYGTNDRFAVDQCSRAVEARLGGGYGNYGGYGGYGYNRYGGGGRVVGITRVERRNSGVRVRGVASSGSYGRSYGYNNADLSFSCKVDYRGRITDVDLDRRGVSYGYNNGYYRGY